MNDTAGTPVPQVASRPVPTPTILLIALALLAPFVLYFGTIASIISIWDSSETFAHGYVILPISLWLIWRRRANFSALPPTPYWPALLLLALLGMGWLAAHIGEVQVIKQYMFVAMIPVIALAVFGRRLAASLAFPLLFLLFAVPFGEIFVGPLIEHTANFTVAAVRAVGIPVLRNGTRFELPTGSWSVVEACSGVRYLISSITLGSLYAYLTFRSTKRRLMFVALSIVVPVVANWLRAFMIVMIGHLSGMELATGVDHLVYGWLFFGLVMFIMFWIGSFWREDEAPTPAPVAAAPVSQVTGRMAPLVAAVLVTAALWPAFAFYNARANLNPRPVQLAAPAIRLGAAPAFAAWNPAYRGPAAQYSGVFQQDATPVSLHLLYYRNQAPFRTLISSVNTLAGPKDPWHEIGNAGVTAELDGRPLALRETRMSGPNGAHMLVWQWMAIDGQTTASNIKGKLMQARAKLLFRGDDGAAILLAAPYEADPATARAALRAFTAGQGKAIDAALAATRAK
ncbi:exosortase A [Massilia sp. S19_KUP03_FR1]|uniref:exosortase A n=1 Tax=Massilia sp. S19_KUP03_FR1 TaxID=3025503 RepID=UPI002FCDB473